MAEDLERTGKVAGFDATKLACADADQTDATVLHTRITPIVEKVDQLGENDPDFDMKVFTDEMWGG